MLKKAPNCKFAGFYKPVWQRSHGTAYLEIGKQQHSLGKMTKGEWQQLKVDSKSPRFLTKVGVRNYWYYEGQFWWEDDDLEPDDLVALLVSKEYALKRKVNRAKAAVARGPESADATRVRVPDSVKQIVFGRDGGRCVKCDSTENLQFDHVIPVALGGSSEATNIQILCGTCNKEKGAGLTTN
jgi:hypothetical protein